MKSSAGFTLVEMLIYLAIIGTISAGFIRYSVSITDSQGKTYVAQEVQANVRTAFNVMSAHIKAANGINTGASTFGSDPGVLSLSMDDSSKSPTIINLTADDGVLQVKEGSSTAVPITSDEVQITNLVFTNLSQSGERAHVRIQMTIAINNDGVESRIYTYSKTLQTSVSTRE